MERVWGGRELEKTYARALPHPSLPFGESWEIVDRETEQSIVDAGQFQGLSLHELWQDHRSEIFGENLDQERFPVLIKVLDAHDDLSIQVHPPSHLAAELRGEPKTEMWFIASAEPGAKLYVGLKNGVTREKFEKSIEDGTVANLVHAISPKAGDSIFIPSGRLHAIGAGFLIHEIQQNSDSTYRVFDWNRVGLDGKPRDLHVAESLASIDFSDFEPEMDQPQGNVLAACDYFKTEKIDLEVGKEISNTDPDRFCILSVVEGSLRSRQGRVFGKGRFILLPRNADPLRTDRATTALRINL